jgi:hypothetical protein
MVPLQEVAGMKVLYERVAGIDVHKDMIKVAIRSPGEEPWTRTTEVLEFRTFYGVLQEVGRLLRRRGVTHVVMEASGIYTDPVYYALAEQDFTEVAVINPAHARALKGHKTDAKDCARSAELFECGLLRGSYMPPAELKEVRDLTRYRINTVQARTSEIQRLGKALESTGIKLGSVACDRSRCDGSRAKISLNSSSGIARGTREGHPGPVPGRALAAGRLHRLVVRAGLPPGAVQRELVDDRPAARLQVIAVEAAQHHLAVGTHRGRIPAAVPRPAATG